MLRLLPILLLLQFHTALAQKSYTDSIALYRLGYKNEFVTEPRSPLKAADTGYLRFFKPDEKYRVLARIELTPDAQAFDMPTHSGKTKKFRQYGLLHFKINGHDLTLQVYQNLSLSKTAGAEDHLFVPFNDKTNYQQTYAGGRYIDLSLKDIQDNNVILDFNKCYNPYCAFADGYNCPIPPVENKLPVPIKAGEMLFGKKRPEH